MGTNSNGVYLNEPVEIIAENPTQYHIKYEDGFEELVDKTEVVVYKKGIKKSNLKRQAKNFEKYYGSVERLTIIKNMPCLICSWLPSDNMHVVSRSAGGTYKDIVNMCNFHHRESHQIGISSFEEKYGIDLTLEAEKLAKIKP